MAGQLSYHRLRQNTHGKTGIHQNTVCEPKPHRYYACAGCTGDVQLRFYAEDKILFKDKEERRTFENYEYKDGILLFRTITETDPETYKFLLLTKDRIFYDNGREVLYLVWYE